MSKFYTAVTQYGNNILLKEIVDGKSKFRKIPYMPSLYFRTQEESIYKTMEGDFLAKRTFRSIKDMKDYVNMYKDVENHEFFGNTNIISQFICEEYPGLIDFDLTQMNTWTIDIETSVSENGFPHPAEANEPIILITMLNNKTKKYYTWGFKPFNIEKAREYKDEFDIDSIELEYRYFKDESELLGDFLFWWKNMQIDCFTGWNTEGFDVIYLCNRITRILGYDATRDLSPFGMIKDRTVKQNEKEYITFDIQGLAHLDYLALYKKFVLSPRESYKLDFIGEVELGVNKLDMGCSFKDSYKDDRWIKFCLYNMRDCQIVDMLEDKLGLIQLAYTVAYDAKCLPNDVFGAVKTWDCMMYRFMLEKNVIVPQPAHRKGWAIEGAYVKEPVPGQYDWIVSFDAASLYPTIMMQYNMSPETLLNGVTRELTVDGLLQKKYDFSDLKDNIGIAANGQCFRNDMDGLFAEIVKQQFDERKMYKKKMQEAEAKMEVLKEEMKRRGIA